MPAMAAAKATDAFVETAVKKPDLSHEVFRLPVGSGFNNLLAVAENQRSGVRSPSKQLETSARPSIIAASSRLSAIALWRLCAGGLRSGRVPFAGDLTLHIAATSFSSEIGNRWL